MCKGFLWLQFHWCQEKKNYQPIFFLSTSTKFLNEMPAVVSSNLFRENTPWSNGLARESKDGSVSENQLRQSSDLAYNWLIHVIHSLRWKIRKKNDRLHAMPVKTPVAFLSNRKTIPNCIWNNTRPRTAKATLRKNTAGGTKVLHFQTQSQATVSKSVRYWRKDRHRPMEQNRTQK